MTDEHSFSRKTLSDVIRISMPPLLIIGLLIIAFYWIFLPTLQNVLITEEKKSLRKMGEVVFELLRSYEEQVQAQELTRPEAQQEVLGRLVNLRYGPGDSGYFWVQDENMRVLSHPVLGPLAPNELDQLVDYEGNNLVAQFRRIANQEGEGYLIYDGPRPGTQDAHAKLSYVRKFEPWQWVFGTGVYIDDVEAELAALQQNAVAGFVVIGALGLLVSAYMIVMQWRSEQRQHRLELQLQQSIKMQAVGQLAGGVAHDFNNILTVISGYIDLILLRANTTVTDRNDLIMVQEAAKRAESITNQLLTFSRKQITKPELLDVNSLVQSALPFLQRAIREDIELETFYDDSVGAIKIDPNQFEQILMNMMVNAREAMPNGGKVVIETRSIELEQRLVERKMDLKPGRYVLITITDNGTGIDPEHIEHVFEPFYTTKPKGQGTGLGLSSVYGIIKQNQGDVSVYSEVGRGTAFKIYFPEQYGAPQTVELKKAQNTGLHGSETIMVVEDNPQVLQLALDSLGQYGYTALSASSRNEAAEVYQRYAGQVDLLLTDVILPDAKGPEIAQDIQAMNPNVEVLYMSGYTDNVVVDNATLYPGVDFLQKPFQPKTLIRKIRSLLDRPASEEEATA